MYIALHIDHTHRKKYETSTLIYIKKILSDQSDRETIAERDTDRSWPTERSTTYHLGGTGFWELDYEVAESSDAPDAATDDSTRTDLSARRTTCFQVVLRNGRSGGGTKTKRDAARRRRVETRFTTEGTGDDAYRDAARKYGVSIERPPSRSGALEDATRRGAATRDDSKTSRASIARRATSNDESLRDDLRKLRGPASRRGKSAGGKQRTARPPDASSRASGYSIMARSRKLCGVNGYKSEREVAGRKDVKSVSGRERAGGSRGVRSNCTNARGHDGCAASDVAADKHRAMVVTPARTSASRNFPTKGNGNGGKNGRKAARYDNDKRKSILAARKAERRDRSGLGCVCDVARTIDDVRSILDRASYPLDEIRRLNCSGCKRIPDETVISIDSDAGEARSLPRPRYNAELLKGQRHVGLEELENVRARDADLENGIVPLFPSFFVFSVDECLGESFGFERKPARAPAARVSLSRSFLDSRDIISLPGLDLNVPCSEDGDSITWLSGVGRPSYAWKRTDGAALLGTKIRASVTRTE